MITEAVLIAAIEERLLPFGFRRAEVQAEIAGVAIASAWVRKTWNTNRGVACVRTPTGHHPGEAAQGIKFALGKALGYFPFFYGIGLQLVCMGAEDAASLDSYVDAIDNQRSIVQSLFAIDLERGRFTAARTWGQVFTGRFQDAIAAALQGAGARERGDEQRT